MPWLSQFSDPQNPQHYDPREKVFCCGEHSRQYARKHALRIRGCRKTRVALSKDSCEFCGSKDLT